LANSLVNALQAKRRFVESLTHYSKYDDNDNFLSPIKQPNTQQTSNETPSQPESPQSPSATQPQSVTQNTVKVKKRPRKKAKSTGEIQLTESEYRRIINLLESRQNRTKSESARKPKRSQRRESVPEWAKLAYASSNPNSRRNQYY
jgi:hypothetical protein